MTMTRLFLCAILLGAACQASAATLYRWIEADGSITFSPDPPAAGIAYDTVQTGGEAATATRPAQPVAKAQPQRPALTQPTQAQNTQGLNYAPSNGAMANGITRANTGSNLAAPRQDIGTSAKRQEVVGSNQKFSQCQDLKKRVVSLERRLRSKLTPDEVDNTVVAIVRYQQSFDQYCL